MVLTTILYDGNAYELCNENSWYFNYQSEHITRKLIAVNKVANTEKIIELLLQLTFTFINLI